MSRPEQSTRDKARLSLWAAIVVLGSILLVLLTLPLLAQSVVVFALVAGTGWLVLFGAMGLLTRHLQRGTAARQFAETVDDDPADGVGAAESG